MFASNKRWDHFLLAQRNGEYEEFVNMESKAIGNFFYNLKVAARMCKQFFMRIFPHIIIEEGVNYYCWSRTVTPTVKKKCRGLHKIKKVHHTS